MRIPKFLCSASSKLPLNLSDYKNLSLKNFSPALQHHRHESNSVENNRNNYQENWYKKPDKQEWMNRSGMRDFPYLPKVNRKLDNSRFSQIDLFKEGYRFRMATRMEQLRPKKNPRELKRGERNLSKSKYDAKSLSDTKRTNPWQLNQDVPRQSISSIQPRPDRRFGSFDENPIREESLENLCEAKPNFAPEEAAIEPSERKSIGMLEPIPEEAFEMKRKKEECDGPVEKSPCDKNPNSTCGKKYRNRDFKEERKKMDPCGKNKKKKKAAADDPLQGLCEEITLNLNAAEPQVSYEMKRRREKCEPIKPKPRVKSPCGTHAGDTCGRSNDPCAGKPTCGLTNQPKCRKEKKEKKEKEKKKKK